MNISQILPRESGFKRKYHTQQEYTCLTFEYPTRGCGWGEKGGLKGGTSVALLTVTEGVPHPHPPKMYMVFGKPIDTSSFNLKFIEEVKKYRYQGNIISSIKQPQQDHFTRNYAFLCDQARKAVYSMTCKIKTNWHLPPEIMFNLFDALITILTYGTDVWGFRSTLWGTVDKVFLQFSRCILHVKATTSNIFTVGECGRLPPSTSCQISA